MDEAFPSESESKAASALLLLSSKLPSIRFFSSITSSSYFINDDDSNIKRKNEILIKEADSSCPSDSKSCSSSLTTEGCSSEESRADRLSILAVAALLHDMKLKVVRRNRSKHYRISDRRKNLWNEWTKLPVIPSQIRREVSSFSSESSSNSSITPVRVGVGEGGGVCEEVMAPSRRMMTIRSVLGKNEPTLSRSRSQSHIEIRTIRRQKSSISSGGRMRRRAEAILKFLSVGCASEVRIRKVLGDSPDTSKALRMLLKQEEVKRSGAGGPRDPYVYTVIGSGSDIESA